MYNRFLVGLILASVTVCPGQESVRTPSFSFGKPVLAVQGDFLGENGTSWLNANGTGTLLLTISNSGTATARRTVVIIAPGSALKDLQILRVDSLGDLKPGEVRTKKIPVSAAEDARTQKGQISVMVRADPGPVSVETKVDISIREIPAPRLDIIISGGGDGITAGEASKVKARVWNTGTGEARGVSATFLPAGPGTDAGLVETGKTVQIGTLAQKTSKEISLTFKPPATADGPAAVVVRLDEERAKFSVFVTLSVLVRTPLAGAEQSGYAAFKKGDYTTAIASFERVVERGNPSKELLFSLGLSYFKNRNRTRCLALMQRAAGLGSKEAKAWIKEHTAPVEVPLVTYRQVDPDPFDGYTPPIGLGVLPFTDSDKHDTPLTEKLYNALKARNEALRIFPFSTIKSAQNSWGLSSLNPSNRQILNALEKELSMNFAVAGVTRDTLGNSFSMQIIRCRDGSTVTTQEFRTTSVSNAIDDAVMFILKGRVPVYTASRSVEVKFP